MSKTRLAAAGDLSLHLDSGTFRLAWREPDWLGPISFLRRSPTAWQGLAGEPNLGAPSESSGEDDLGAYTRWDWPLEPIRPSVRAYRDRSLLVFRLEAAADIPAELATENFARPYAAWPACSLSARQADGIPAGATSFVHQWAEFALPAFGDANGRGYMFAPHRPHVVTPFALIAPDGRTLLLAPLDRFHEQVIAVPQDGADDAPLLRCGWHGDLSEVTAGFSTEFAVWAGGDFRTVLTQWAEYLLRANGTKRPSRYADVFNAKLSYWTDNGAVYYYRTIPDCRYDETLERVVAKLAEDDIPVASFQIDSWFYPHELLRPASPEGAPIVPPTGAMSWEPREDFFPDGFGELRERLGDLPLGFHSRHFSSKSPYWQRYDAWLDGDYAHPQSPEFYRMLLGQAHAWGAQLYEQDWLVESHLGVRGLRAAPGRTRAWQQAMDDAAGALGMTLQWCMATPADFLQTVSLSNVTSIRTSGDYKYMFDNGFNWTWFLHTNALARALGLWPYKDVFISYGPEGGIGGEPYREVEALLSALSGGPVGIGDAIGAWDRAMILRTCREDGVLVKPDVPLAAFSECFSSNSLLVPRLLLGECYTDHPAGRWWYVTAFNTFQSKERIEGRVAVGRLTGDASAVVYDWRRQTWQRLGAGDDWSVNLEYQDWDFRVVCPELVGGVAVFGDVTKYASVGDRRVRSVKVVAGEVEVAVVGVPGSTVEISGWSAGKPAAFREWAPAWGVRECDGSRWSWDPATRGWRVQVEVARGGETLVRIHV